MARDQLENRPGIVTRRRVLTTSAALGGLVPGINAMRPPSVSASVDARNTSGHDEIEVRVPSD
jgi:hypothetical protein